MDEVCTHLKRLIFYDNRVMKDGKSNISILTEWEGIQERFLKVDDNMKLYIKEKRRKIDYLETTNLKRSSQPIKRKCASNKVKPTSSNNSTMWSPSYF